MEGNLRLFLLPKSEIEYRIDKGCYLIAFPDPENARNKKIIFDLACILTEIGKVTCDNT